MSNQAVVSDGKAPMQSSGSLLKRLARDRAGNTLAIVGAALLPLTAMIGSGVDMSRAYMAKTRLQNACDSAALAARRVMTADQLTGPVRQEAIRFFNFNFPQNLYETASFEPVVERPAPGTVRVTADTEIPTTIMGLFGFSTLPLTVTCDATLNLINTDVMFVLDTTGSMNCLPPDPWYTQCPTEKPGSKMQALRNATMDLYDELSTVQTRLEEQGYRLRYGVMPYSSGVNVGSLLTELDTNYLVGEWEYWTLVAKYDTPVHIANAPTTSGPVQEIHGSPIEKGACRDYGRNRRFKGPEKGGGAPPQPTWTRTYSNDPTEGVDWGWSGAAVTTGKKRTCRRRYVQTDTTYQTRYSFTDWLWAQDQVDVSQYATGNSITIARNGEGTVAEAGNYDLVELAQKAEGVGTETVTWAGCIEERDTVTSIVDGYGYDIPAGAFDLDIDLFPTSEATRWRPYFPDIARRPISTKLNTEPGSVVQPQDVIQPQIACPAPARRLQAWNRADLSTYIDGLAATGGTYHDNGMSWGTRMLSPNGIFGADNPDSFNTMPVARHIIYFTDGQLDTGPVIYSTRGMERWDKRVTGEAGYTTEADLNGRHQQRFRMLCNEAKQRGITIWVVTLATSLTDDLRNCASSTDHASETANQAQLRARFIEIGRNIGALRLAQ